MIPVLTGIRAGIDSDTGDIHYDFDLSEFS